MKKLSEKRFSYPGIENDEKSVHAIGNGEIMLYGRGPEWLQVIGQPYSCPSVLSLMVARTRSQRVSLSCRSHRREGSGCWEHNLKRNRHTADDLGIFIDCASRQSHCIARHWALSDTVDLILSTHYKKTRIDARFSNIPGLCAVYCVALPATASVYYDYPLGVNTTMMFAIQAPAENCFIEETAHGSLITLSGEGTIYVTGGMDDPTCYELMKIALQTPFDEMLNTTEAEDAEFLKKCEMCRSAQKINLRGGSKGKKRISDIIDDTLMMIRAQQHKSGGILSGMDYHIANVRDQYGISRGLLLMGALGMARKILIYYEEVFRHYQRIATAQGIGLTDTGFSRMFHVHENDSAEITGYLLMQVMDYYCATGDKALFEDLLPLCRWAMSEQFRHLHEGMIPFNGDEAYFACGLLPRTIINHGSLEATLIFIASVQRFLYLCRTLNLEDAQYEEHWALVREAEQKFNDNFLRGDCYVTNAYHRVMALTPAKQTIEPLYRHGVCYFNDSFGWLRREAEGCYVCPVCACKENLDILLVPCKSEYFLPDTLMFAPYIGSRMISDEILYHVTDETITRFRRKGDLTTGTGVERCPGYSYGYLLYSAAYCGIDADDLVWHMVDLHEETGSFTEYYDNGSPSGSPCRAWETAVNITAIITYMRKPERTRRKPVYGSGL